MKILRLYIHNLTCFANFEFKTESKPSLMIIGKNGTGKTSFLEALAILIDVALGRASMGQLFGPPAPEVNHIGGIRLEVDLESSGRNYTYQLAVGVSDDGKSWYVKEEHLSSGGQSVLARIGSRVTMYGREGLPEGATFDLASGQFALPIVQCAKLSDPVAQFRLAMSNIFILQPIPSLLTAEARDGEGVLRRDGSGFASWLAFVLSSWPSAYSVIDAYLRTVFPDFKNIVTLPDPVSGVKHYFIQFENGDVVLPLLISKLSNGEKCQLLAAAIMGVNSAIAGGVVCAWDEPTNYLALSESGSLVAALRSTFAKAGQLIVTAHSEEAILQFPEENTYVFSRKTHLDPVLPPATLTELRARSLLTGDLATALRLGDVENER